MILRNKFPDISERNPFLKWGLVETRGDKKGLPKISATSFNMWAESPSAWISKYILKVDQEPNVAMHRGTTAEKVLYNVLIGHSKFEDIEKEAEATFRQRTTMLGTEEEKIKEIKNDRIVVNGADLVDGTPIFDIKPYHPQADRPSDFNSGYISELNREKLKVTWSCPKPSESAHIEDVLSQDPRPSYHRHTYKNREYGISLHNLNIKFVIRGHEICILETQLTKK